MGTKGFEEVTAEQNCFAPEIRSYFVNPSLLITLITNSMERRVSKRTGEEKWEAKLLNVNSEAINSLMIRLHNKQFVSEEMR